jgi:hypothetical protein
MKTKGFIWLILRLLLSLFLPYGLAFAFLESTSSGKHWLFVSAGLFSYFGFRAIQLLIKRTTFHFRFQLELVENRLEPFHLLMAPFCFIGIFCILMREIYAYAPEWFVLQVAIDNIKSNTWILFSIDQVVRAILFDFLETYKIHISSLDYKPIFLLGTIIFIFKTVLALTFWEFVLRFFRLWPRNPKFNKSNS